MTRISSLACIPGVQTALAFSAFTFLSVCSVACTSFDPSLRPSRRFIPRRSVSAFLGLPPSHALPAQGGPQKGFIRLLGAPPASSFITSRDNPTPPPEAAAAAAAEEEAEQQQEQQEEQERKMAWRSHGNTNAQLVNNLRRNGVFSDQAVYDAMMKVDRGHFVQTDPYADTPQPVGYGATISAPHMHAMALEELRRHLLPGKKALDVGSGSGYLTVCMALMVGVGTDANGVAVGIDYIQGLVDLSRRNVQASFPKLLSEPNFKLIKGDGWKGAPVEGPPGAPPPSWGPPYDAIHVGAAAAAVPAALLQQLAPGGRMVIPVECIGGGIDIEGRGRQALPAGACMFGGQVLVAVDKDAKGGVVVTPVTGVMYVPLVRQQD